MPSAEHKRNVAALLLAFALGVLWTLLLTSRSNNRSYVPFGSTGQQILDTRNGGVYVQTAGRDTWHILVRKVGET